jgi:uncharacterized membrane protein YphA (DoxX/SURF4 family)
MSNSSLQNQPSVIWKEWEKILFRIAFVYFILMCIPTSADWYKGIFSIDWTSLHYRDFYDIARFGSGIPYFGNELFGSRLNGYAVWVITLLLSIPVGLIWTFFDSKRIVPVRNYDLLYYWLRTIVRYRAAIGIIGFGFTKLLPVQMPYPSESLLNNNFGDLTGHKIYWLSIGLSPWYQIFGGIVEVSAGVLLMFRKTTAFGAALLFGALLTITFVNLGYDGGVQVYAGYFALLAAFLLVYDAPAIYRLLIREEYTVPRQYYPLLSMSWQRYGRILLKTVTFGLFIFLLFYLQWVNFRYDPYKQPSTPGVAALRGYYNVEEFRINNKLLPYSPLDRVRWQEVTFEKWSSLTFKVNKAVQIDLSNGGGDPMKDIDRTFELTGVAGGRRVFHYIADTLNHLLYLEDKNNPFAAGRRGGTGGRANKKELERSDKDTIYPVNWIPENTLNTVGNEFARVDEKAQNARRKKAFETDPVVKARRKMILQYAASPDGSSVTLKGTDENRDSVWIVLKRADRNYILSESKLVAGKY